VDYHRKLETLEKRSYSFCRFCATFFYDWYYANNKVLDVGRSKIWTRPICYDSLHYRWYATFSSWLLVQAV